MEQGAYKGSLFAVALCTVFTFATLEVRLKITHLLCLVFPHCALLVIG